LIFSRWRDVSKEVGGWKLMIIWWRCKTWDSDLEEIDRGWNELGIWRIIGTSQHLGLNKGESYNYVHMHSCIWNWGEIFSAQEVSLAHLLREVDVQPSLLGSSPQGRRFGFLLLKNTLRSSPTLYSF
jgi:hypothetical protein